MSDLLTMPTLPLTLHEVLLNGSKLVPGEEQGMLMPKNLKSNNNKEIDYL